MLPTLTIRIAVAAGSATVLLAAGAVAAQAGPARAEESPIAPQVVTAGLDVWDPDTGEFLPAGSPQAQDALEAFWTPERMAQAQPATPDLDSTALSTPSSLPSPDDVTEREVAEPSPAAGNAQREFGASTSHQSNANGKVFFWDPVDQQSYICSGATVTSNNSSVVSTAAHCTHSGGADGYTMANWVFVPGYDNGTEPLGEFQGLTTVLSSGWTQDRDYDYDYAFVVMDSNANGNVADAAGGHGLRLNAGFDYIHHPAYPFNYDQGQTPQLCEGESRRYSLILPIDHRHTIDCDFGGGSSGGPFLEEYNDGGNGYIVSTQSQGDGSVVVGPHLDDHAGDVYDSAQNS